MREFLYFLVENSIRVVWTSRIVTSSSTWSGKYCMAAEVLWTLFDLRFLKGSSLLVCCFCDGESLLTGKRNFRIIRLFSSVFLTFKMGGHFSAQLFNLSHGTLTYRQSQLHRVRKEKKCYDKRNVLKFVFEVSKLYILHEYYHAPTGWTCNLKSMKFILSVDFMYLPSVWCDVNFHTCS